MPDKLMDRGMRLAGLVELWRAASFLGLVLIGLGSVYRRFGLGLEREAGSVDHPG